MKTTLLSLLVFSTSSCFAQISPVELDLTGVGQPVYTTNEALRKAKVKQIRETYYEADTVTHKVDMKKPTKITLYAFDYLGDQMLPLQQIAAMGTDTNTLVENFQWGYDSAGRPIKNATASTTFGFDMGGVTEIVRNGDGLITGKAFAVTFDLKVPAKPTDYKVRCSTDLNNNISTANFTSVENGSEHTKRHSFTYDKNRNMLSCKVEDEKEGLETEDYYTYDNTNHVTEEKYIWHTTTTEYVEEDIDDWGMGPKSGLQKVKKTTTTVYKYEYDAQYRLVKQTTTVDGVLDHWDEYIYSAKGIPETIKTYNSKGLTAITQLACQ